MPTCLFLTPEFERYDFIGDNWIEVKRQLTQGETDRLQAQWMRALESKPAKGTTAVNEEHYHSMEVLRAAAYLVGWSLVDQKGNQTKPSVELLDALPPIVMRQLDTVVQDHIAKVAAEADAERPFTAPA